VDVTADADSLTVGGKKIKVFACKDPALPRLDFGGRADRDRIDASSRTPKRPASIFADVKKVIISAPRRMKTSPSS